MFKKGFTLAEVLITLITIGVLAAMTIPSLVNNINEQQYKLAFKKGFSDASQAWSLVVAENPGVYIVKGGWGECTWPSGETLNYNADDGRINAFKAKFNVVKTCINEEGCWPVTYENYSNLIGDSNAAKKYSWVTSNGMCWAAPWYSYDEVHIMLDTNCNNGPNLIGKDIFSLLLGADGVIYFGLDNMSPNGKPVSSGNVCPKATAPVTINGRSVDFRDYLIN